MALKPAKNTICLWYDKDAEEAARLLEGLGFKVERLDMHGDILDSRHLLPSSFEQHGLAQALACGQLFTASVSRDIDGTA